MYVSPNLQNFYRTKQASLMDYLKAMLAGAAVGGGAGGLGGAGYGYREGIDNEEDRQASLDEILGRVTDTTNDRLRAIRDEEGREHHLNELRQARSGFATERESQYLSEAADRYNFKVDQLRDAEIPLTGGERILPVMMQAELDAMDRSWRGLREQEDIMSELDAALAEGTERTRSRTHDALDSRTRVENIIEGVRGDVPESTTIRDRGLQGAGLGALIGGAGGLSYQALKDLLFSGGK